MQRFHRIFANGNDAFKNFLDQNRIGHKYEESIVGKTVFLLIPESDESWPILAENIEKFDVFHTVELRFTNADVRNASWCQLGVTSHFGYPQPEDDFGYREITYDPSVGCRKCGIGLVQIAPFRFRKPPTTTRSHLLQLNWVFGEFFVSAEARTHIETAGITGIHYESPVLHRTDEAIPGWFQMKTIETAVFEVDASRLTVEACTECSQQKFNQPQSEMLRFKSSFRHSGPDVYRTTEWFGSGGSAYNTVLVSQRFVTMMLEMKWRGLHLTPVAC
jgi:hypothetical protein